MTQIYSIVSECCINHVYECPTPNSNISECHKCLPFGILEIRKFPWHFTHPFKQRNFQELLNFLGGLTVTIGGYGDMDISRLEEQLDCLASSGPLFFGHLDCATDLKLVAFCKRPIGLAFLKPGTATFLHYLYLEDIIICNKLIEFLKSVHETSEQLTLWDCYCSINDEDSEGDDFYWKYLFDGLYEAGLPHFTLLQICPLRPTMISSDEDGPMLRTEMPKVKKMLEANEKRRVLTSINSRRRNKHRSISEGR